MAIGWKLNPIEVTAKLRVAGAGTGLKAASFHGGNKIAQLVKYC